MRRRWNWLRDVPSDVRLALRHLRRTPLLTAIIVATLALAIGANAVIFSIVNGLLLRTLPVHEPRQLVSLGTASSGIYGFPAGFSYDMWQRIRRQQGRAVDGALAWSGIGPAPIAFNLSRGGVADTVDGLFVSGEFFSTLGVPALLGRTFTADDDVMGGGASGPVSVISYGLWQRRFGGAADIIGRPLLVQGLATTIVGVTPPEFLGVEVGQAFDVALPLGHEPLVNGSGSWGDGSWTSPNGPAFLAVMLRLKPGQSIAAAEAAVRAWQPALAELVGEHRDSFLKDPFVLTPAGAGTSQLRTQYARPIVTLLVITGFVLLIACANVANLLLARATMRTHEMSVRSALGAPRWRLARLLLAESLLLAIAGALFGLLAAAWGSELLVSQLSTWYLRVELPVAIDARVLAFTALITVGTTLLLGTAPAFQAARATPLSVLRGALPGATGGAVWMGRRIGLPGGFVIAQVALSLVLVFAAGLFARTFTHVARLPLGFDSGRVLIADVDFARAHVEPGERVALSQRLADAVAATPGAVRAAASRNTPINFGLLRVAEFHAEGFEAPARGLSTVDTVTPGWFSTYGIRLRAGRDFSARDTIGSEPVAIINETFARTYFPGANPIGRTITTRRRDSRQADQMGPTDVRTIIGIVDTVANMVIKDDEGSLIVYEPLAQSRFEPAATMSISVRAAAGVAPLALARGVADALTTVDPRLSFSLRPLAVQVEAELAQDRLLAIVSGFFGALALLLAALGLYGVTAASVTQRRMEIGVRMALGAVHANIVRLVLARVTRLVAGRVAVGLLASVVLSRFVAALLYGVEPRDPLALSVAAGTLLIIGTLAAWIPARRAARIEPARALRDR